MRRVVRPLLTRQERTLHQDRRRMGNDPLRGAGGIIMPKTLYLHVGTHKTGTTAIQALLTTQSEAWAQGGLFVPRSGRIHDLSGHHNVAWELNADARYRPAFGTLADLCEELKASPHAVAVISSEDFEYLYSDPRALRALKTAFEGCGYQVEVLMFLREQGAMIGSLYQELLKHGLDKGYGAFTCAMVKRGEFVMHGKWCYCLSYERLVAGFAAVFGEAHVHCRRYERPVETAFLDLVGYHLTGKPDGVGHAGGENQALPDLKVRALQRYNAWVSRQGVPESRASLGRQVIIHAKFADNGRGTSAWGAGLWPRLCGVVRWRHTNRWLQRKKGVRLAPLPPRSVWRALARRAYARLALVDRWRIVRRLTDSARAAACGR